MSRQPRAGSPGRVARIAFLAVAVLLGATADAHSSRSASLHPVSVPGPPINVRWSGYVVTAPGVSFTHVSGTWTEPVVSCTKGAEPAVSTVWVGLGGYTTASSVLDQIGTDANCDTAGRPSYSAWFELLPDVAHSIGKEVAAGDTMVGSVAIKKTNLIELTLRDLSRDWTFAAAIQVGVPDGSSAEWVVEAPYRCLRFTCHQAPLANFGTVAIRGIAATGNGRQGTLADRSWRWTPLLAAPCAQRSASPDAATGAAAAIPDAPSADGKEFEVEWAHQPGPTRDCPGGVAGGVPDVTLG